MPPRVRPLTTLAAAACLLLAGCGPTVQPASSARPAPPSAPDAPARGLRTPLAEGVSITFPHADLLDLQQHIGAARLRNVVLEPLHTPMDDAVRQLEQGLLDAGFVLSSDDGRGDAIARRYRRSGASHAPATLSLVATPYSDAAGAVHAGGTGSIAITVRQSD